MHTYIIVIVILMAIKSVILAHNTMFSDEENRIFYFIAFLVKIGLIMWGIAVL